MPETVTITTLGHSGDGIVETGEGRVFVPYALPGEVVEIERTGNRGRPVRILRASNARVPPVCRHFTACGICSVEHMERSAYLAWKRQLVATAFAQQGIDTDVEPIVPIAIGSRRRAIFSAIKTTRGLTLGFHRRASDEIVAIEECAVLTPVIVERLQLFREIAALALKPRKPARVIVLLADNGLDIAVEGAAKPTPATLEALGSFGADQAFARLTVNGTEVFRNRLPEISTGHAILMPTPGGFVQAAKAAETALADAVLAHVADTTPVADLFAGIGTFTLRLARGTAVTAVDGDQALVGAIEAATRRATGLKRVTTRRRDLFANPLSPVELGAFATVVFDPPAAGAKAQSEALAASSVKRVAAVSCNPATLARDARILIDGGYRLTRVLPVDQFLFSAEIEVAATFER